MIKQTKIFFFLLIFVLFFTSLVFAYPGIPHQIYGYVEVNGQPVPDNTVIVVTVDGDSYTTVTKDSRYGYAPNIFYVEDPDGDRAGETMTLYIGGMEVETIEFQNNAENEGNGEELEHPLTTTCGDTYCLGDETCDSCSSDCGTCMGLPVITINSPVEGKTYDTTKIDLEVTADQDILVWMYSLNDADPVTFSPNIIITAEEGENEVTVVGINQAFQSGSSKISFTVELPDAYCGDGACNGDETCSGCSGDCGSCSNPPSGGSDDSGGSSGGSTGGSKTTTCVEDWECKGWSVCKSDSTRTCFNWVDNNNCGTVKQSNVEACVYKGEVEEEKPSIEDENNVPGITGAVVGSGRRTSTYLGIGAVLFVVIVGIWQGRNYMKRKRNNFL